MKTRTLKIESAGDYWRGQVSPKIRLAGQWLERAGFKPGSRVEIIISEPGTLTLRFIDQFSPPAMKPVCEENIFENTNNRTETGQSKIVRGSSGQLKT
jgi:hypothetical protein